MPKPQPGSSNASSPTSRIAFTPSSTDNGSEFTDRFAVDMKNKPHDRPSAGIPLTASAPTKGRAPPRQALSTADQWPRRALQPSNRRGHRPSARARHRTSPVRLARRSRRLPWRFVHDYNRTRLKVSDTSPRSKSSTISGPNTCAGTSGESRNDICSCTVYLNSSDLMMIGTTLVCSMTLPMST